MTAPATPGPALRVFAPGKLVLGGAYAVLEGHQGLVVAVSRGATARGTAATTAYEEVRAAGAVPAEIDASCMYLDGQKLGLGGSAAALVATLGLRAAEAGADLRAASTRADIFTRAYEAHARAQGGGSGIDLAASVHGGTLAYTRNASALPRSLALPDTVVLRTYFSGRSASTREMRARIDAFAGRDPAGYAACIDALGAAAEKAIAACASSDAAAFVYACRATEHALTELGERADAAVVTPELAAATAYLAAHCAEAAFFPAGAGGGDAVVYVGTREPPGAFEQSLRGHGMVALPLALDSEGVRTLHNDSTDSRT